MTDKRKWLGEERRSKILSLLQETSSPLTGGALADKLNVSRQVVVQDISLLKARNIPITATSQGYVLTEEKGNTLPYSRLVPCKHSPERTEEELHLLVDHGIMVKDVKIKHPVYGDISSPIMVSNRKEVKQFLTRIKETGASFLLELTEGIHFHTLEAKSEEDLDEALAALNEAGILLEEN
ncbi:MULTISPECIES: transcription repressor NadR [Bacillaceae]|uniref:Transcription repressor NadR n=1 Tax=Evansella alkalicola TaxID=745819 RepID=A0ABS6JQE2_9BACI|nr:MULTISPECIES: transcription repressor NadR [Bacillaceae]MBU9720767.1 transcription repressor NadR [Bacillus alkalicola]